MFLRFPKGTLANLFSLFFGQIDEDSIELFSLKQEKTNFKHRGDFI